MRISDWSSDVCSSDLRRRGRGGDIGAVGPDGPHHRWRLDGSERYRRLRLRGYAQTERDRGSRQNQQRPQGNERQAVKFARLFKIRSEEHTSELQSLMRISYAVFCLKKKNKKTKQYKDIVSRSHNQIVQSAAT